MATLSAERKNKLRGQKVVSSAGQEEEETKAKEVKFDAARSAKFGNTGGSRRWSRD